MIFKLGIIIQVKKKKYFILVPICVLFSFCVAVLLTNKTATQKNQITFAFVTDTHIGRNQASEDLERTVKDINSLKDIDFTVVTGDVSNFGSDRELEEAKFILGQLKKPWFVIPGNHDTKWSESGANSFRKVFGSDHFSFEYGGYLFLGCSSGPNMRMSPGLVPREDLVWLESVVEKIKGNGQPVIFLNHYPLDEGLGNWYKVIDILKQINIQAVLCGHGHRNRIMNFEGIPAVMGRSNLRGIDEPGAYNLVVISGDSIQFSARHPGEKTKPPWHSILLENHHFEQDTTNYNRPSYQINQKYYEVKESWKLQDSSDIGSGIAANDTIIVYTNTSGKAVAVRLSDGEKLWQYQTHGKIYSTPAIKDKQVVVASTDGYVYCLKLSDGSVLWKMKTSKGIVASPAIYDDTVYIGSSEGKFRALSLVDGRMIWEFDQIDGFVETKPLVDKQHIYFGGWGEYFYALDRQSGTLIWKWKGNTPGHFYSPAACFPVSAFGKIFLATPDRYVTALDAQTGEEVWRTNRVQARESIGISEDKSQIFITTYILLMLVYRY